MERQLSFELPSDLQCIEEAVEEMVMGCATCEEIKGRLHFNFRVCLAEAIANAIIYGNGHDPRKRVRVEVEVHSERVVARVTDQGVGFDPSLIPDPTIPANVSRTHGRGLFLMKKLVDEVHFNAKGNEVTLVIRRVTSPSHREASA